MLCVNFLDDCVLHELLLAFVLVLLMSEQWFFFQQKSHRVHVHIHV